jgi:hypothetical protein
LGIGDCGLGLLDWGLGIGFSGFREINTLRFKIQALVTIL